MLSEGAWIFEDGVPTPATWFQDVRNQQTIKYTYNLSLPEYSPNQLERNDQELSENVSYWTTYFLSFPRTGSQSVEGLPADYPSSPICCLQWWCLYDPMTEITSTYNTINNDLMQFVILTTVIHQSIWHAWFANSIIKCANVNCWNMYQYNNTERFLVFCHIKFPSK